MFGGDRGRGQFRVTKILLYEGVDLGQERPMAGVQRHRVANLQLVGEGRGQRFQREGGQPGRVGGAVLVDVPGEPKEEGRGERPDTLGARNAHGGQAVEIPGRQRQQGTRESQDQQPSDGESVESAAEYGREVS